MCQCRTEGIHAVRFISPERVHTHVKRVVYVQVPPVTKIARKRLEMELGAAASSGRAPQSLGRAICRHILQYGRRVLKVREQGPIPIRHILEVLIVGLI